MKQLFDIFLKAILAATTNYFITDLKNQWQHNEDVYFKRLDTSRKKICSISYSVFEYISTVGPPDAIKYALYIYSVAEYCYCSASPTLRHMRNELRQCLFDYRDHIDDVTERCKSEPMEMCAPLFAKLSQEAQGLIELCCQVIEKSYCPAWEQIKVDTHWFWVRRKVTC